MVSFVFAAIVAKIATLLILIRHLSILHSQADKELPPIPAKGVVKTVATELIETPQDR